MSDILKSSCIEGDENFRPEYSENLSKTVEFFKISSKVTHNTDQELSHFGRSLPRDGFLSLYTLNIALQNIDLTNYKPGRVGLYTAFINGPMLSDVFNKITEMTFTEQMRYVKKWWPPKQHFRQNAPLRATHFAIKYKLNGPQMCFVNPYSGLGQAFDAARIDLRLKEVDLAIVTSSFSLEDWQTASLYSSNTSRLKEGSVSVVFSNPNLHISANKVTEYTHGICTPYINSKVGQ